MGDVLIGSEHLNFLLPPYMRGELNEHSLIFTTTYKCNLNCNYCPYKNDNTYGVSLEDEDKLYIDDQHSAITIESIEKTIKEIECNSDREFTAITIHGPGEPLIRWKEISYLLNRLKKGVKNIKQDSKVTLMTNGTLLGNKKIYEEIYKYNDMLIMCYNNTGFNEIQLNSCTKTKSYIVNRENIIKNMTSFNNKLFKIILTIDYALNLEYIIRFIHKEFDAKTISINIDNNNPKLFDINSINATVFIANLIASWKFCKENLIDLYWTFQCTKDTKTYAHPFIPMKFSNKTEYCDYNILTGSDDNDPQVRYRFMLRDEYYNTVCSKCIAFGKCNPCLFAVDHNTEDKTIINWNDCTTITLIETVFQSLENEFKARVLDLFKNEKTEDSK